MSNYTVVELRKMYVARGYSAAEARSLHKAELAAALGLSMSQGKRRSAKGRKRKSRSPKRKSGSPKRRASHRSRTPSPKRSKTPSPRHSPSKMKVEDLKKYLRSHNQPVSGKKATLVKRVHDLQGGEVHPKSMSPKDKRKALGCSTSGDKPCVTKKARAAKKSLPKDPTVVELDKALEHAGMKLTGNKAEKKRRLAKPTGESYTDTEVAKAAKKRVSGKRKSAGKKKSPSKRTSHRSGTPKKRGRGRPRKA